jgi:hypothetical protein
MTDSNDLTPWEDINPPMVSAQRQELQSLSSEDEARAVFRNELTACLALVAPAGMTEENRRDWLTVAWQTLQDVPPDILRVGANIARQKCDHPSKIVPTILEETKEQRKWRSESRRQTEGGPLALPAPPKPEPNFCTPEEAKKILSEFGIKKSWET